jgi:hypothetical protein
MIQANKQCIEASFKGVKIDVVSQTLRAITLVEILIADARST